jgi:hypothetical protein
VTFFDANYIEAYKQMINELREFLVDKEVDAMNLTRLEFRSDLKRGDKKRIWMALAKMLRAGGKDRSVMTEHYDQNDLFRWLSDKRHCNLAEKFQSAQRSVNKVVESDF